MLSVTNWKTITLPQRGRGHRPLEEGGSPSAADAALLPGLLDAGDGPREVAVFAPEEDLLVPLFVEGGRAVSIIPGLEL